MLFMMGEAIHNLRHWQLATPGVMGHHRAVVCSLNPGHVIVRMCPRLILVACGPLTIVYDSNFE
jgi:hypothetical protein